jgi:hypothetical protein
MFLSDVLHMHYNGFSDRENFVLNCSVGGCFFDIFSLIEL